jgi:hypothetical protein
MKSRLRLRLSAATALAVALAVVLTACGSGGGRRGHGSGGSSGGYSSGGSSGDYDDDDYDIDDDLDELDDLPTDDYDYGTDDPAPTDPSSVSLSSVLPDLLALSGTVFTVSGQEQSDAGFCGDYPEVCANTTDRAQIAFTNDADDEFASFQVVAYASEADAVDAMATGEDALATDGGYIVRAEDTIGDASVSYDVAPTDGDEAQVTVIQHGPYLGAVARGADDEAMLRDWGLADAMSVMYHERMEQAAAGQEPNATVDL